MGLESQKQLLEYSCMYMFKVLQRSARDIHALACVVSGQYQAINSQPIQLQFAPGH
jgi:hypothetical protein